MARMLGRYQAPGCCPGAREGWKRTRRLHGLDCSGAASSTRHRKRAEQRQVARELRPEGLLPVRWDDPTDCGHGCNGECLTDGSEACTFVCHPDGQVTEEQYWAAQAALVMSLRGSE
jgi:hypothetical protein